MLRVLFDDPGVEAIARIVAGQDYGSSRNSYDQLLTDDEGRVWVRTVDASHRYHPMYMAQLPELRPRQYIWEIRDHTGRLAGRVSMPSRFRPKTVVGGRVYGFFEEDDGDETLRVAPVPKWPSGGPL